MPKKDMITVEGEVKECLPGTLFRIEIENGKEIIGHLCGKMRMNSIHVIVGDKITLEMSPYDLTKGRIVRRNNK